MSTQVTVWAQDARRTVVKVGPGTSMFSVLEEACQKLKLSTDKYTLKHAKKQFQLNDAFRVTGLPPGAKLELVAKSKTPSVVNIALKLPEPLAQAVPNGRLMKKFRTDTTLWKVLRQLEADGTPDGKKLNFTARATPQTSNGVQAGSGQLYYEMPVLRIMNREIATLADYQKTLSQVGLDSGSHMIQMSFNTTEETLGEAMDKMLQFFKGDDATEGQEQEAVLKAEPTKAPAQAPAPTHAESSSSAPPVETVEEVTQSEPPREDRPTAADGTPDAMDVDEPAAAPRDPLKPTAIFSAPTNATPVAATVNLPDSYYTPTIAHAQLHQQKLQESAVNKRLKSDAEIDADARAEEAKVAAVKKIIVKVRFPDGTTSQWDFGPDVTGATLYQAVRGVMANGSAPFKLVLPGPLSVSSHIKDDTGVKHNLIKGYKLSGRVLLNFVWDDKVSQDIKKAPFLKPEFARAAQKIDVPDIPVVEDEPEPSAAPKQTQPKPSDSGESSGSGKKMPKWLKLPGKK